MLQLLRIWAQQWPVRLSVIAAALTYNNWFLGPWLNPILFSKSGSISEYSVAGQPHYLVFRLLDILSGLLLTVIAVLFINTLAKSRVGKLILVTTFILGVANIADALAALPCSETLNNHCVIPVSISLSHYQVPAHGYSSTLIALCYFLLPLAGVMYGLGRRSQFILITSSLVVADALASFVSAIINYIHNHSLSVRTSGTGQEVGMIILAVWLIGFYLYIQRFSQPKDKEQS